MLTNLLYFLITLVICPHITSFDFLDESVGGRSNTLETGNVFEQRRVSDTIKSASVFVAFLDVLLDGLKHRQSPILPNSMDSRRRRSIHCQRISSQVGSGLHLSFKQPTTGIRVSGISRHDIWIQSDRQTRQLSNVGFSEK